MNYSIIRYILCRVLEFEGAFLILPCIVACIYGEKEGFALAIREDLRAVVKSRAFCMHMKDILEYRTMDYYRRRYERE